MDRCFLRNYDVTYVNWVERKVVRQIMVHDATVVQCAITVDENNVF